MEHVLKFSFSDKSGGVVVRYQVELKGAFDTITLESNDEPSEELKLALQSLAPYVCRLCEFPAAWEEDLTVRGVTVKPAAGDDPGLTITALRRLQHSDTPLVINTPFGKAAGALVLALDQLTSRALDYAKGGERAQGELGLSIAQ